ncbi:hypothetical protein Pmar_PMAR019271, partial [Perkinsus marinus ATCC 50983]
MSLLLCLLIMASINGNDLSIEEVGSDVSRISGGTRGSGVTIGIHRGAGNVAFEDVQLPCPVPDTMVSAIITRTGHGQDIADDYEEEESHDNGTESDDGPDEDDKASKRDDHERYRSRRSTPLSSDILLPPLGVANHTKRNLAAIDALMAEADPRAGDANLSLPRLEGALMM